MAPLTYIANNKNQLVKLTQDLVRIPTVNPPGDNYVRIVDFIETYCKRLGLSVRRIIVPKEFLKDCLITGGSKRINLLVYWQVGAKKTLHINGHYDVVPATRNWKMPPFKAIVKNKRIYGRGTEDMKANIAAVLFALKALKELDKRPALNLELSFTPDEETGGKAGLGYLVNKNFVNPDFAIGEGYSDWYIASANKGLLWLEITVYGKSAHASQPYRGINASVSAAHLIVKLERLAKNISRRKTSLFVRQKKDAYSSMAVATMLSGGTKINTVSDKISFTVDRRFLPEEEISMVKNEILNVTNDFKIKNKGIKISVKILACERPVNISGDNPLSKNFARAIKSVLNKKARFCLMPGATDMRYFIYKGIPAVGYAVRGLDRCHSDDEFVFIDSLIKTSQVFCALIKDFSI